MKSERTKELRLQLRKNLPAKTFEPQPFYGYTAFAASVTFGVLVVTAHLVSPPWYVLALLSILLGQLLAHSAFAAHEAMHGALFKNKFWSQLLVYVGYAPYFFGVETWRAWHVRAHHAHTNKEHLDPDVIGLTKDYRGSLMARFQETFTIGSGRWPSILSLFLQFTVQSQIILWYHGPKWIKRESNKVQFNLFRARTETICLAIFWAAVAWSLGGWHSMWLLLFPFLMSNATFMSYICTQHFLRPLNVHNDPLPNTISVRTYRWLDWIHLYFSYHREHHLFPSMSHSMGPVVRQQMKEMGYGAPVLTHWQALKHVLMTPRLYHDSHTLEEKTSGEKTDLVEFWQNIDADEADIIQAVPQRGFGEADSTLKPPKPHFAIDKPGEVKQEVTQ